MVEKKMPEVTKPEEKKAEEVKVEEKKSDEPNDAQEPAPTQEEAPVPVQEIVLKVFMHCEGCAKKVRRWLKNFPGVEDVETDIKTQKVVVKGDKADPTAVQARLEKKSNRKVELLFPIPKPEDPKPEEKKAEGDEKTHEKKEEEPITVVLGGVHMHCEACANEIKRRLFKMSGVKLVEPDLKASTVTVRGFIDPEKVAEIMQKKRGKIASFTIIKEEPDNKKEEGKGKGKEEKGKGEKKAEDGGDNAVADEKKEGGGEKAVPTQAEGDLEVVNAVELRKSEFYYNYPQNYHVEPYPPVPYPPAPYPPSYEMHPYEQQYAPQLFSDENPNACSVM